jgi:hypothetical protein
VAVVAQAGFTVIVLALEEDGVVEPVDKELVDGAGGAVVGGPDDFAGCVGDLGGGAVGVVVIVVDLFVGVNDGQGDEGAQDLFL